MGQAASQGEHLEDAFMRTLGLQIQHLAPGEAVVAGEVTPPRDTQATASWLSRLMKT